MNNSKRIYRAAIYVRLSKEDGDLDDVRKAESNSISNQKSLILNYLKDKEDIEIVSIREDDGYSGATFDRPAFKLMMQDVKDGIIDCIVVKDLSRFAREYIDAGRYIERMFPAMGIRFIAINDAYDSADTQAQGNEIIIPFKNLINDAYCRDISIKIRSHLETKRQNGEFVGNYCVYGYKKSEIDHNVIVPDEYAGHVVQDIFCWIKNGMSLDAISDKLNVLGILSPMAYKLSNGENYKTAFQKKDELLWTPVAVRRIATNIIYTGTLVQGKITTPNHKVKTKILKPQEKWAVSHNNHEALVSLRTFQIVQRLLSVDMRMAPGKDSIYLLSGIAVCADCGALMTRKVSTVNGKKYVYYMCSNNKKNKKCSSHRIKEADLESRVFDTLRDMTASDEMFDEVNKMLRVEARGIEKSTKKRKKNLFICPYCGRKLMNSSAVCTPKLLCPKRRMVRTGECQQIFMLKSEAQDKVLEITKEICRTLIQEEELKKASKDKRKVTSDEYLISELKAEYDRISNSTVSCYQSYREGKYTKEEYVQLRKTNQELLADLENQISDLQEKVANQEPDAEEKIEQLTQYSMLEQYDGDVLSNIIDKVLIYNDKDIEVVFKGENFIRNAV